MKFQKIKKVIGVLFSFLLLISFVSAEEGLKIENNITQGGSVVSEVVKTDRVILAKRGFRRSSFSRAKSTKTVKSKKADDASKKDSSKKGLLGGLLGGFLGGALMGSIFGSIFGGGFGTFFLVLILIGVFYIIFNIYKKNKEKEKYANRTTEPEIIEVEEVK